MAPQRPDGEDSRDGRGRTAGWSAAVIFDALVPLVIGTIVLLVLILAFLESSPNY
jgi:hypothetical protein